MRPKLETVLQARNCIAAFALLVVTYLGFSFLDKPSQAVLAHYHLSSDRALLLTISVAIPLVIIWLVGLYGSLAIKEYAQLVKDSPEGLPLNTISNGFLILVLSQPFTSDIGDIISVIVRHTPHAIAPLTIIDNYLQIILMALALTLIAQGSAQLSALIAKKKNSNTTSQQLWVLGFIIISAVYSYLLTGHQLHTTGGPHIYYMDNWLILLTIAVPYLFFWYRGLSAAYHIYGYQKNVTGHLYKGSLTYVAAGVVAVIISSIFVRLITTISYTITRLSLTPILFIIYGFLLLTALGFALMTWGAKKLRRIEEV